MEHGKASLTCKHNRFSCLRTETAKFQTSKLLEFQTPKRRHTLNDSLNIDKMEFLGASNNVLIMNNRNICDRLQLHQCEFSNVLSSSDRINFTQNCWAYIKHTAPKNLLPTPHIKASMKAPHQIFNNSLQPIQQGG